MLGTLFGQFVGGVIWGVGATLAGSVVGEGGPESLRDVTKMAVKTYLTAASRLEAAANEARQNFESMIAEVESEMATEAHDEAA